MNRKHALVLMSGGQDSTTCLFWALASFERVTAVGFDYQQSHKAELKAAKAICDDAGVRYNIIYETGIKDVANSVILGSYHGIDGRPPSFVPGRNIVFLSLAGALAVKIGADALVVGSCQEDAEGYPDCGGRFLRAMRTTLCLGLGIREPELELLAPLLYSTKAQTWELAEKLGCLEAVRNQSMTCYRGDRSPNEWGMGCGECDACLKRQAGWEAYSANR